MGRIILIIALVSVLVMGLVTSAGCGGADSSGDISNGKTPNGETPNGEATDGGEPENGGAETDSSGMALITSCEENTGTDPEAGDPAPDFQFQNADGQTVSLSDYRGTPVVLNFWTTECGYCILELPRLQQLYDQRPATELVLLTIVKGEEPAVVASFMQELMQEEDVSLPVVVDRAEIASTQYGVSGAPVTFFIDKDGIIQVKKSGYFHSFEEIEDILAQLGW